MRREIDGDMLVIARRVKSVVIGCCRRVASMA